jgi:hypothetical protein
MNAWRAANIFYYVAHIDYIQYIGGLKPIGEGASLYVYVYNSCWPAISPNTISRMGIIYTLAHVLVVLHNTLPTGHETSHDG